VTGWHLLAIKSGQMAGLSVPKETGKRVELFLDQCETAQKGSYADSPGGRANPTATATALLCRMYLGITPRNPGLRSGIDKVIKPNPPGKTSSLDYAFYASQVMHHIGQEDWKAWSMGPDGKSGVRDVLLKRQVAGGKDAGSWAAGKTGLEQAGGRLAATSLALLTLEIPSRGFSLYRRGINVDLPRSKN
jgi:hypothetical protein